MQSDKPLAAAAAFDLPRRAGPKAGRQVGHKAHAKAGKPQALSTEQAALLDAYFATLDRLKGLQDFFQRITDSDLISSCIYEMNAAQKQYAYLHRRLKEEGVTYLKILR